MARKQGSKVGRKAQLEDPDATGPTFDTNRGRSNIDIFLTKSLEADIPRVLQAIWDGNTNHRPVSMKVLNEKLSLECRAGLVSQ